MRRFLIGLTTATLLGSAATTSAAAGPAAPGHLFDSADLDEALPPGISRVLVLESSPADPDSERVAADLSRAVERTGAVAIRLRDTAAPVTSAMDAGEAVRLCTAEHAQAVAVVEVLTPAPHVTATARLWTARGDRVRAVVGPPAASEPGPAGRSKYVVFDRAHAYAGADKRQLEDAEFYDVVGRPDLASSRRLRSVVRGVLFTGAAVTGVVGGLGAMLDDAAYHASNSVEDFGCSLGRATSPSSDPQRPCTRSYKKSDVPTFLMVGSLTMLLAGVLIPSEPLTFEQRKALARQHNLRLRANAVMAVPFATPEGGGMLVSARF